MRIPYEQSLSVGSDFVELTEDVIAVILQTVRDGWQFAVASPDVHARAGEVPMTERLRDGMRAVHLFLRTQEHDPHAILECKRVSGSDAHLCREYVAQGMDRFSSGKYGRNHAVGFLVGYVISGSPQEAADGVNRYLQKFSRDAEKLTPSSVVPAFHTWRSTHARSRSTSIELHHALLKVAA